MKILIIIPIFFITCLNDYKLATGKEGLVMVAFDTELFGHWWFEGVELIKQVIKKFQIPLILK